MSGSGRRWRLRTGPGCSTATISNDSTVEAATPRRLRDEAIRHEVEVIDAPVSGGFMGAHEGTLALMVGGSD